MQTLDSVFDDVVERGRARLPEGRHAGIRGTRAERSEGSLSRIGTVQIELALVALYDGELGFFELSEMLGAEGYALIGLEPGFSDPRSGRLLQVDGIFHRHP